MPISESGNGLVIRTEGLRKDYQMGPTSVQALRGVDLAVPRGEMIAIMGASGSGKSTLMNILGALDEPTAGRYFLDGVQVDGLSRDALAEIRNRKIGFVFQGYNLLARTSALENVELPMLYARGLKASAARQRAREALERVGLGDRLTHEPSELSGGEQQRVAIARALVNEPAILLADEPTGNLDSRTTLEILALFQSLNEQGLTLVIVTHEDDVAHHAQRIIELRDGRVIRDEPVLHRRNAAGALPPAAAREAS
jgi:putative ABC transport system ATP-binding protein